MPGPSDTVRRAQLITTYGPGSIVALGDEAFMVAGTDRWDLPGIHDIHERRLEQVLRVQGFNQPPAVAQEMGVHSASVPVVRFPRFYSCSECNLVDYFSRLAVPKTNDCSKCGGLLVPSRFVVACSRGHIDDFPYSRWVHGGTPPEGDHQLKLSSSGSSAALRDLIVSCSCGASRPLEDIFDRQRLSEVTRCQGRRPWLGDSEDCGESLRSLQRGASNVWFGAVASALSIPPWSDGVYRLIERQWPLLKDLDDPAMLRLVMGKYGAPLIAKGHTLDELVNTVLARQADDHGDAPDHEQLRAQEYRALLAGRAETSRDQHFVAYPAKAPVEVRPWFDDVVSAPRLREVRALTGFSRLKGGPVGEGGVTIAPISAQDLDWLPAMEVLGEGVLLTLNADRLEAWEAADVVRARIAELDRRVADRALEEGMPAPAPMLPRLVLLHTLSHVLINQLSLDAGYPAAALRERLFSSADMAGTLVYTATSDSAGSLGGIVAQTEPVRLPGLISEAIGRATWCSSDPVCMESTVSGAGGLNLAACHACSLLPETSCERRNELLDRALLVGTATEPQLGFFFGLGAR